MSLTDDDKQWIREQLERLETSFGQQIERVETSLLTEFHKWASPLEARIRSHSAALRALDLEMEAQADRLKKLEEPPLNQ